MRRLQRLVLRTYLLASISATRDDGNSADLEELHVALLSVVSCAGKGLVVLGAVGEVRGRSRSSRPILLRNSEFVGGKF